MVMSVLWVVMLLQLKPDNGDSKFLQNGGIYLPLSPHSVTTQKTNTDICTAIRMLYLKKC
jgi:hypothetical protein